MRRRFVQRAGRTSAPRVWSIVRDGNCVTTTWGQEGGDLQTTLRAFGAVNAGRANEKSPEQAAQEWLERQILLQTRSGYVEVEAAAETAASSASGGGVAAAAATVDWSRPLPTSLRFTKPQNGPSKALEKLVADGKAWWLRKRDGLMYAVVVDDRAELALYSSTMAPSHKDEPTTPWLARFPHIREALEALSLPPRTILLGELVAVTGERGGYELEDLETVNRVARSKTPLARALQGFGDPAEVRIEPGAIRPIRTKLVLWDVAFWAGEPWIATRSYRERLELLAVRTPASFPGLLPSVEHVEYFMDQQLVTERLQEAKRNGWEGYVVVDPDLVYGPDAVSFHGKPFRHKLVGKYKPTLEADFILRWDPANGVGEYGKGKRAKSIGSLAAYLWDPTRSEAEGREVFVANVGGGLSDQLASELADLTRTRYPLVGQVEFASWTDKGSLQFPQLVRVRDDKRPDECLFDQRPTSARAPETDEGEGEGETTGTVSDLPHDLSFVARQLHEAAPWKTILPAAESPNGTLFVDEAPGKEEDPT